MIRINIKNSDKLEGSGRSLMARFFFAKPLDFFDNMLYNIIEDR